MQPEQEPDAQLLDCCSVQLTHSAPAAPHCSSLVPAAQLILSVVQQPLHLRGSQTHLPSEHELPSGQLPQPPASVGTKPSDGVRSPLELSGAPASRDITCPSAHPPIIATTASRPTSLIRTTCLLYGKNGHMIKFIHAAPRQKGARNKDQNHKKDKQRISSERVIFPPQLVLLLSSPHV